VKFPTAGNLEFNADLAMYAVVGFATAPPGALFTRMRSELLPVSTSTPETNNPGNAVLIALWGLSLGNPQER
jgi:hypothetical protein